VTELVAIARQAVEIGNQLVVTATDRRPRIKSDRDVVTDVDLAVEHAVRSFLSQETPEIAFLGEEDGGHAQLKGQEPVWVLDPVDGTSNFAHGVPLCAVSLGLVQEDEPVVAAMAAPFLGLRYHAAKGEGAFGDGTRLKASATVEIAKAIVSIGDYAVGPDAAAKNFTRFRLTEWLAGRAERVRMFGTAALDLAWVAEGRTDATIMLSNKPWDTAAGVLLAREAGAVVVDADGNRHTMSSTETVAVTPGLLTEILSATRRR
jgi:myo-inositol-1(or 4)-monophosphatase